MKNPEMKSGGRAINALEHLIRNNSHSASRLEKAGANIINLTFN